MNRARVTVVEQVYCCTADDQPLSQENRFQLRITSDEQPYFRRFRISENWQPLDAGWLQSASMVVIANEEGKQQTKIPTPDEAAELAARVVEVGRDGIAFARVRPGATARFEPAALTQLQLRCCSGTATVTLMAAPE